MCQPIHMKAVPSLHTRIEEEDSSKQYTADVFISIIYNP